MPNHVKNVIRFTVGGENGDAVFSDLLDKLLSKDQSGHTYFDFNNLIPMPESLNIVAGSDTDIGILLYKAVAKSRALPESGIDRIFRATKCGDIFMRGTIEDLALQYRSLAKEFHPDVCEHPNANAAMSIINRLYEKAKVLVALYSWEDGAKKTTASVFDIDGVAGYTIDHLKRRMADANINTLSADALQRYISTPEGSKLYDLGEKAVSNTEKYGSATWYDWCCRQWGTKWNSYDGKINRIAGVISFSTAWSCPHPIVEKLAEMFPSVYFTWEYADEDCGCNTGFYTHEDGELSCVMYDNCTDEAYQTYVDCWGESECMYKNEDGCWRRYSCDDCPHEC